MNKNVLPFSCGAERNCGPFRQDHSLRHLLGPCIAMREYLVEAVVDVHEVGAERVEDPVRRPRRFLVP